MKTSDSLHGLRVLNTRPQEQAHELSQKIREAGGIALELPALEIKTINNWLSSLPDLKKVDQAIFISANAVRHCFSELNINHIEWPSTIKVIAIGQGTAAALHAFKITVSALPEVPDSEHLLALKILQPSERDTVLLFKGEGGRELIENNLRKRKIDLKVFHVYQRVMPKINRQFITAIWHDDLVDIILLTSEQSLHNLFKLFDQKAHDWLKNKTWLTISERLAQIASSLKIRNVRISQPHRIIDTLFDYVEKD